jgi:hypothetical protein
VVHFIFERLEQLTANNESGFREYVRMLEVLSVNRNLEKVIEEEEKPCSAKSKPANSPHSISDLKQGLIEGKARRESSKESSKGLEGKLEGKLEGEVTVLCRLMTRRFGPIGEATQARLDNATLEQLEQWTDNILDAATLDDVFNSANTSARK